jgi:hypothetical protein
LDSHLLRRLTISVAGVTSNSGCWTTPSMGDSRRRHKWNALTYERGNDVDVKLVDLARRNPSSGCVIPAWRAGAPQMPSPAPTRIPHHASPVSGVSGRTRSGELRVDHPAFPTLFSVIGESPIVGLASPKDAVDCRVKLGHAVIVRGRRCSHPRSSQCKR